VARIAGNAIRPHDLSRIIDSIGFREFSPGHIDGAEAAPAIQKTLRVSAKRVEGSSHDLPRIVKTTGIRGDSPGHTDGGEMASAIEKPLRAVKGQDIGPHDLPCIVDVEGFRVESPWHTDGGKAASAREKPLGISAGSEPYYLPTIINALSLAIGLFGCCNDGVTSAPSSRRHTEGNHK